MSIALKPWLNLDNELKGMQIICHTLDWAGRLFVLGTDPSVKMEYGEDKWPKWKADTPHDYVVIVATENTTMQYVIPQQHWHYDFIQPLPNDELLLVCRQARYRDIGDFDRNACVFAHDGTLKRKFLLGDAISDIQTMIDGTIWTSYDDHGYPYDWFISEDQVIDTVYGLIQWDRQGNKQCAYETPEGNSGITSCYALNVISDHEVWLYYYGMSPIFTLAKQINGRVEKLWESPIIGSDNVAIWRDYVLFCGSYDNHQRVYLYQLSDTEVMNKVAEYDLFNEADYRSMVTVRSNLIVVRREHEFFQLDMADMVRALS